MADVSRACSRIAPSWPLDRMIAVNPMWGVTGGTVENASSMLESLCGSRLVMPLAWYRTRFEAGHFSAAHIARALELASDRRDADELVARLVDGEEMAPASRRMSVVDTVDTARDTSHAMSWSDFVLRDISQFCAAYFDEGQASAGPVREGGLYAAWLRHSRVDHNASWLMGLTRFTKLVDALPADPKQVVAETLEALGITSEQREKYLTSLLLDIHGWASWCAFLKWEAGLKGQHDGHMVELLAIRAAWELILSRGSPHFIQHRWQQAMLDWERCDTSPAVHQRDAWIFQHALELAYQEQVSKGLSASRPPTRTSIPVAQAVFCIDVRSEVIRRALEACSPEVHTLGFAGFFGVPIEYMPAASSTGLSQLPGLLSPSLKVEERGFPEQDSLHLASRLQHKSAWKAVRSGSVSGFSFVESTGLLYAGGLVADAFGLRKCNHTPTASPTGTSRHATCKMHLAAQADGSPLTNEARTDLAAKILRGMSLTKGFAPIVALIGHGSGTTNNPHAAGLHCGACGGNTGEVNARAVARLLNNRVVRVGLATRGINIPESTHFVPGLHNTTTDDIVLYDTDEVPAASKAYLAKLEAWFAEAGNTAREERAPSLNCGHLKGKKLHRELVRRAKDWSQVRPEWGLANNAAFVAAQRSRTKHMNLGGRSFLHEYRWDLDRDGSVLELIMTAPMIVAHWINFQYYASTVDNRRFGSGSKVLHNVVGGHIGVFEGNGGDLRTGLSLQSVHNGKDWVHTPQRLSVFIEAPRGAISGVIDRHEKVRHLVEHGWIHLFQIDSSDGGVHAYRNGTWEPIAVSTSLDHAAQHFQGAAP